VTSALVRYEAMCAAITECHRIDEVKDLRDKAMALELYARQARNTDAERKASEIRLRAERRTGELLKELERAQGKRSDLTSSNGATKSESAYAVALESNGISRQTASRYQALANVPAEDFEQALRDPVSRPSTTRIIQQARDPAPQIDDDALWLWGRLRDFEREKFSHMNPTDLLASMTESMRSDVVRIAPSMAEFLMLFAEVPLESA
jgi:hypothetical protein